MGPWSQQIPLGVGGIGLVEEALPSRSPSSVLDCSAEQGSWFNSSSNLPDQYSPILLEIPALERISATSLYSPSL